MLVLSLTKGFDHALHRICSQARAFIPDRIELDCTGLPSDSAISMAAAEYAAHYQIGVLVG